MLMKNQCAIISLLRLSKPNGHLSLKLIWESQMRMVSAKSREIPLRARCSTNLARWKKLLPTSFRRASLSRRRKQARPGNYSKKLTSMGLWARTSMLWRL